MTLLTSLLNTDSSVKAEIFDTVNTFADLPSNAILNRIYQVLNSTGFLINRKVKGLYYYDGAQWQLITGLEANSVLYNNIDSNLSATNVKAGLDELDGNKYDSSNPDNYETPAELNARDTANRQRSNHTGTQTASTISDFNTAVANSPSVSLNTSKISADGSVTTHNDITSAGSGQIITVAERNNLSNQSGTNTGDETTLSIQTKRPLKTIEGQSIEGSGNIDLDKNAVGLGNVQNIDTTIAANINYSNTSSGLASANVQAAVDELSSSIIPVGSFILYPVASIPSGYVIANGAALNKVTYSSLYSVYGNDFGETAQTFNIPDLLSFGGNFGMFIRAGNFSNVGRVQDESVGSHNHVISIAWNNQDGFAKRLRRALATGSFNDNFSTDNNTGTTENRPKAFTSLVLIKY